jgi:ribosomal protein L7/L12
MPGGRADPSLTCWRKRKKIDWTKAPDWARWVAVDDDGEAFVFENEPRLNTTGTVWMPRPSTSEREFLSKGPRPEDCSKELYERPAKAELKIDWSKAPAWTQWLAVDADGEAYWFEHEPKVVRELWDNEAGDVEFAFSTQVPENFTKELYERPAKADLKIDWNKAPSWAQWLAVDAIGSAYWYCERPELRGDGIKQWDFPFLSRHNFEYAFNVEGLEDFTQALYERPATNEETTMTYNIERITAVRIKTDSETVEVSEGQWQSARDLVSLVDPELGEGRWPKVKCIKLYRNMQPGMGLREAKAVVEAAWQERNSFY